VFPEDGGGLQGGNAWERFGHEEFLNRRTGDQEVFFADMKIS
jgi:hypothetical protein